jgi:hypothetical protein
MGMPHGSAVAQELEQEGHVREARAAQDQPWCLDTHDSSPGGQPHAREIIPAPKYGLSSLEPVESGGKVEDAEKGRGGFLVAGSDGTPFLQPRPEPLDLVSVV